MLVFGSTLNFFFLGGIFECCCNWTSQFFPSHETDGKLRFVFISLSSLYFQISPNSLKSWKIGIFESPLVSYQIVSLSGMCQRGREPIYNGIVSFQVKKCSQLYNKFVSVQVLEILLPSLYAAKNCKIYMFLTLRFVDVIERTTLLCQGLVLLNLFNV